MPGTGNRARWRALIRAFLLISPAGLPLHASEPPAVSEAPGHFMQVSARIYSGAQPERPAHYAHLRSLGIVAIVCVDGAAPNIQSAREFGLRHIHIPVGYAGLSDEQIAQLAQAAAEVKGKFYIHCHHGKHRAPTAAAIAAMCADEIDRPAAIQVLQKAGTGSDYTGLWQAVRTFKKPLPQTPPPALQETAEVESLAGAMAQIDRIYDRLKRFQANQWRPLAKHPDLVASREALQLQELFTEIGRVADPPLEPGLAHSFTQSVERTHALRSALIDHNLPTTETHFNAIQRSCKHCHNTHRN